MASNGTVRGQMRPSHGRSPPFIVIGLFVVIAILGFNYWTTSSRNSELQIELADVQDQSRVLSMQKSSMEKRNDDAMLRIHNCDESLSQCKVVHEKREKECQTLNDQIKNNEKDVNEAKKDVIVQKDNMERCLENGTRLMEELELIKRDKEDLSSTISQLQEQLEQKRKEIMSILANCNTADKRNIFRHSNIENNRLSNNENNRPLPNNENNRLPNNEDSNPLNNENNRPVPNNDIPANQKANPKRLIQMPNNIPNEDDQAQLLALHPQPLQENALAAVVRMPEIKLQDSPRDQIILPVRDDVNNNHIDTVENDKVKDTDDEHNVDEKNIEKQPQPGGDYDVKEQGQGIDNHINMDQAAGAAAAAGGGDVGKVGMMNVGEYGNDVKLPGGMPDAGAQQDYGKELKVLSNKLPLSTNQTDDLPPKEDAIDKLHQNMKQID